MVSQKVNNLNYDSLIRYFSMQMAAVLPEEVDADSISYTLTNDQGIDIAENAVMAPAKVNLNQSGEDWALLAAGDSNYDSSKEKNAVVANFKPEWLENENGNGMPLNGEQYYLTVKGKVKEGVADGTVLTFQGVSSFNEKKTLVTEETCKVLDQNTRLELESLNDVFKYEITTRVPQDAVSLTITDTLVDVLEVVGMPSVNSTASGEININGNMVTCKFADVTSDRGKPITLTITAKIKDGVTFQQLYDEYGVDKKETQIPNQAVASYQLKNNATTEIITNKVVVVPLAGLSLTKLVGDVCATCQGKGSQEETTTSTVSVNYAYSATPPEPLALWPVVVKKDGRYYIPELYGYGDRYMSVSFNNNPEIKNIELIDKGVFVENGGIQCSATEITNITAADYQNYVIPYDYLRDNVIPSLVFPRDAAYVAAYQYWQNHMNEFTRLENDRFDKNDLFFRVELATGETKIIEAKRSSMDSTKWTVVNDAEQEKSIETLTIDISYEKRCSVCGGTGVHPQVNSIPQAFQNDEFTFQVTLTDGQDQPLTGSYPLLINGEDKGTITNGGTVKLKANQKFTIQKLPVGSKYSITEKDIPKHWHKTTEANTAGVIVADTDAYIANALPLTSVSVSKVWDDANDQDGKRPAEIAVTLNADGEAQESVVLNEANGWKHTFENLPAKDAGEDIKYTVTETLPKDYSMSQQGEGTDNVTITNKYTPGKTSVAVLKHWDDGHDQDGKRPASVTVELLADGVPTGKTLTLDAAGAWGGIFEDLDDMKDGQDIAYTVQETNVPTGYAATVTGSVDTRFEITNTHAPEITQIDVTKVWDDNDDAAGKRPNQIIVKLHANGLEIDRRTVTAADEWKASFPNLPVYQKGVKVVYTITEELISDYTHQIDQDTFTITNTYDPTHTDVEVEKTWNMGDHADVEHPESVIVKLLADGVDTGMTLELNAENKWAGEFEDLDLKKDDKLIVYTVEEIPIKNFISQVVAEDDYDFLIVNEYIPPEPEPVPTVQPTPSPTPPPTPTPTPTPTRNPYQYKFSFTKKWQGDAGDSINWTFYNPDGTERSKKFDKKIISETEWYYEGWFASEADYYLVEKVPEGYMVHYENVGAHAGETDRCYNGGTIINYKVPKTGDDANPALWIALAALGIGGLALLLKKRRASAR